MKHSNMRKERVVIIVAGITRSGLSLTMQMLAAGGYPCAGTFPDYEPFPIGQIPWSGIDGMAVKLVDAHRQLPPVGPKYRIIRLNRNKTEQARSINKWMAAFFHLSANVSVLLGSLRRDYETIDAWASEHDTLVLEFESIIKSPRESAERIVEWLGCPLDIDEMVKAVKPRGVECYQGLLELELISGMP